MNLFVTDYDDTLYTNEKSIVKNIESLKELKKHQFIIMISTGRSYPSIKMQVEKFNIPFDYLSCADGSIIYNKEGKILYCQYINPEIIDCFVNFYQSLKYEEIQFSYNEGYSNILKNKNKLLGINICLSTDNYNQDIVKRFYKLKEKYPNYNYLDYKHPNFSYLCIKPLNISKSYSIKILKEKLNIDDANIYVIGDSANDYEMIYDYKGVGMTKSSPKILEIVSKTYDEVNEYILDIMKKI